MFLLQNLQGIAKQKLTAFFALLLLFLACGEVGHFSDSDSDSESESGCGAYNSLEQFCFGGKIYPRCGGEKYDPNERFCFENKFYLLCGDEEYNPSLEFCLDKKHYLRCGGKEMNPIEEFCFDTKAYKKCKGENYNPLEEFCWDGELEKTCGSLPYDLDLEFCTDFKVYAKCNKKQFDPKKQACIFVDKSNILYYLCGGNKDEYSKDSTCTSTMKLCGQELYNFSQKFCGEDSIAHNLCNGKRFNTSTEFCGKTGNVKLKCNSKLCGESVSGTPLYCLEEFDDENYVCAGNKLDIKPPPPPTPVTEKCGAVEFDPTKEFCDTLTYKTYPMCGSLKMKPDVCCNGVIYDKSTQFCFRDELYSNCNKGIININIPNYPEGVYYPYNPLDSGCFTDGKLYPNCQNENSRGLCVHNSLLRCRQEGKGDEHIRDPLPGMNCVNDSLDAKNLGANIGAIIGNSTAGKVAQIGKQIWLRDNVNNGTFYSWAGANALPEDCNGRDDGECNPTDGKLHRALCPAGFFMARDDDWDELMKYAGGASIAGGRLKSQTGWSNNGNGTDNYGFSAKPGGYYEGILLPGGLVETNSRSMWWSENSLTGMGSYWTIISEDTELRHAFQLKGMYKAQVRCLYYYNRVD